MLLAECLHRMGNDFGLAAPAACASEGAPEYYRSQPHPRQVMSPNSSQTLPQDLSAPNREADANVRTKVSSTKSKYEESTTSVPMMVPVKEDFFDVKEDLESGSVGSGAGVPTQANVYDRVTGIPQRNPLKWKPS